MDANLLHTSYEGKILEDPWQPPDESMFSGLFHLKKPQINQQLLN